jgi:hypothetical protein
MDSPTFSAQPNLAADLKFVTSTHSEREEKRRNLHHHSLYPRIVSFVPPRDTTNLINCSFLEGSLLL